MKYSELNDYIVDNALLSNNLICKSGIYAITIDDYVAYVGQSKNVY